MIAPQPIPRTLPRWQRIVALTMIGISTALIGGCTMGQNPDKSPHLTGEQKIQLIDSMRNKGSYEAARERLTATAQIIADRVSAAIPGQTWKFNDDSYGQDFYRNGSLCKELSADIARRPMAKPVDFGSTFSAEDFKIAANIVREEAAKYGATTESSLFNESAKRDYDVQGNGYEFRLLQIKFATLNITG
ncbi:LppA family lipoprotein, partial [Mycobacterium tuberculosis]|uniref:LppA family lipoprotein n=1 Tax=Mycobacterium tuberculosis TaxID=1773 RepID=UPI00070E23F1